MIPEKIIQEFIISRIQSEVYHTDKIKKYCICILEVENGFKKERV